MGVDKHHKFWNSDHSCMVSNFEYAVSRLAVSLWAILTPYTYGATASTDPTPPGYTAYKSHCALLNGYLCEIV